MLVFQNAIKRAGLPILRSLNIQFRLTQLALTLRVVTSWYFQSRVLPRRGIGAFLEKRPTFLFRSNRSRMCLWKTRIERLPKREHHEL